MLKDNLGPQNRWERVSQGESSHIARFLAEFELGSARFPERASTAHRSLMDLLYVGLQRDMVYSQLLQHFSKFPEAPEAYRYYRGGLFFTEARDYLEAFLGPDPDDSKEEKEVFFTSREGWSKTLDAPQIKGFKGGNKLRIEISANGRSESQYNSEAIPRTGLDTIIIGEEGDVTGIIWSGQRKELTKIQRDGLVEMFKEIKERAIASWERNKGTLASIQSAR